MPIARRRARDAQGLSVEVGNTDAEGRLVLCDALALADAERPDLIIDFATLTGAARVALGPELPALFGIRRAGRRRPRARGRGRARSAVADAAVEAYDDELGSKIADLNNVASGLAGAIFGALFLKRFVTEVGRVGCISTCMPGIRRIGPGRSVGAEASGGARRLSLSDGALR
jgi:leucyl aminopeptidase